MYRPARLNLYKSAPGAHVVDQPRENRTMRRETGAKWTLCVFIAALSPSLVRAAEPSIPEVDQAFDRLYNFDFAGSHRILNGYIAAHPGEAVPYAARASAYLFYELDRLGVLESQFLTDDEQILEKRKITPDPVIRAEFFKAVGEAQSRARRTLASAPDDPDSLLAMCIGFGVVSDYTALVEKRQFRSMSPAKAANIYAQRLLRLKPPLYDAYVSTGVSEYLIGSMPIFLRWFVRFDNIKGSKQEALKNLELVSREGHYLKGFAKVLLSIIYLREKKREAAVAMLAELQREYPANPLFRRELAQLSSRPRRAR
jgi:hypothetical protein